VPRPSRACSCYLLRSQEAAVLLDLGSGAFSNLREAIDYTALDAIVISHMHADHFLDLIPLRYALKYGPLQREGRIALYMPPGGEKVLRNLCAAFTSEGPLDFLDEVFVVNEYQMQRPMEINDVRLTFTKTIHYVDAYAMRAQSNAASIAYSADTAPCESVVNLARGCDLFLCESTLGLGEVDVPRGHLTAPEAGEMARRAEAGRLVLTHYGSEYAPGELEDEAEMRFHGPCAVADDGMELSV
jgi:ribonuclease BN (tRNA processing enzyme)